MWRAFSVQVNVGCFVRVAETGSNAGLTTGVLFLSTINCEFNRANIL